MITEIWLARHGETEWSLSGAHTSRTDIPLTPQGEQQARALPSLLPDDFSLVLTSPLRRAHDTARLAGFASAQVEPLLVEWNYGIYEGRTTAEVRRTQPNWSIWETDIPGGETVEQVAARAHSLIDRLNTATGRALLFGHGHMSRILTACWLGLPPLAARHFVLSPASVCTLGYERETPAILRWNVTTDRPVP